MGVTEKVRLEVEGGDFDKGLGVAEGRFGQFIQKVGQLQSKVASIGAVVKGLGILQFGQQLIRIGTLVGDQIERARVRALERGVRLAGGGRAGAESRQLLERAGRIREEAPGAVGVFLGRIGQAAKSLLFPLTNLRRESESVGEAFRRNVDAISEERDARLAEARALEERAKILGAAERFARGVLIPGAVGELQAAGVPADLIRAFQKQVENQSRLSVIQQAAAETLQRAAALMERSLGIPGLLGASSGSSIR